MQVTNSHRNWLLSSLTLAPSCSPVATMFGFRPAKAVIVGILVMFVVTLGAFLIYLLKLPPDRGDGN